MYIICQRLTAQPIRDLFLRLNITTRLHFLRHLEVSLSAAWHGKRDFTKAEQDRFDHCGGVNASRTLVNLNHTKLSDHLLISFISLVEIVQMADRLSYIRLQVNVIKTEAIPRLLTVDRARFNTITDRMRVEAGWVGRREDGLILLAEYRKTD